MKRRTKRWLAAAITLFAAGFVVLNVLAYNHARAMMRFSAGGPKTHKPERLSLLSKVRVLLTGINVPRPANARPQSALASDCEALEIPGPGNVTLSAWYVNRGVGTPLVVLFHGYASEKTCLLEEAEAFLGVGSSVLLVDFRGSGGSSESYTTIGVVEADDVTSVVAYSREKLKHSSLILFGQSMGAAAILRAIHAGSVKPDAVVLEAVFDTLLNTVKNRFALMGVPSFPSAQLLVFWGGRQCGFDGFAHNPVEYARSLACPSLFMHGSDDPRATLAEGRRVFDAASGSKVFKEFNHSGHESYVATHREEWTAAVGGFIASMDRACVLKKKPE